MAKLFRFKLRTALAVFTAVALIFALAANFYSNRLTQKRNVAELIELGGEFHARQGSISNIQVWYDGDLRWSEDEARFKLTLASSLGERTGINRWLFENFGLDFVESPVALEIDCHDFGESTLNSEIVSQINKLPTVRQVWIKEWFDENGNPVNELTSADLEKLFPELIVASPQ